MTLKRPLGFRQGQVQFRPGFLNLKIPRKKFAIKNNFFSSYLIKADRSYLPRNITSIRKIAGLFPERLLFSSISM
jgi:hypothetical protein